VQLSNKINGLDLAPFSEKVENHCSNTFQESFGRLIPSTHRRFGLSGKITTSWYHRYNEWWTSDFGG